MVWELLLYLLGNVVGTLATGAQSHGKSRLTGFVGPVVLLVEADNVLVKHSMWRGRSIHWQFSALLDQLDVLWNKEVQLDSGVWEVGDEEVEELPVWKLGVHPGGVLDENNLWDSDDDLSKTAWLALVACGWHLDGIACGVLGK